MYREFADREDIAWSRRQLEALQTIDRLLAKLNPSLPPSPAQGLLTYKSLLLTLWARYRLALPEEVRPLTPQQFRPFFQELFRKPGPERGRRIEDAQRTDFLRWLADRTRQTADELSTTVGVLLESLFVELEAHYGRVSSDHIDPRYIQHFLLESR